MYIIIGTTTHNITEYFTYSPKNNIKFCDNTNSSSHQLENVFRFKQYIINPKTNHTIENMKVPQIMSNIIHHVNGIIK